MSKVSVVVPIYKVERYLGNCIESLIGQTLKDIEIILVDDGSPDNCPSICDEYAAKDGRIKVIHKPNGGVSAARNDGLKAATGEYILFCDSDDWMELDAFEVLYEAATTNDSDIAIGDVYMTYGDGGNKYVKFYKDGFTTLDRSYITELIKADIYRTYCPMPPAEGAAFGYGGPWNKLVKRELLIKNVIEFDLRVKGIFDDILYTAHILADAEKVTYVQKPVYYYRIINTSITRTFKPNVVEINTAIFNSWEEFFASQPNGNEYREAFCACVLRRLEESIRLYFINDKNEKSKAELKKELSDLIKQEPYKSAVRRADFSKVSKKQKMIAILGRFGCIGLVYKIRAFR